MSNTPGDLKYTKSHEWLRENEDGSVTIGITDHAQSQLGDLVFVELPEAGKAVGAGDAFAVVESVKAASDVYSPIAGEVKEVNEALNDSPELVNQDPYGDGYLAVIKPGAGGDNADLMDAKAYEASLKDE